MGSFVKRLVAVAVVLGAAACGERTPPGVEHAVERAPATAQYADTVEPVLAKRCAVCHGCYDAPCQLDLTSFDGLERGAFKKPVYDSSRLISMQPTRLYIDEKSEAGWRKRGFWSVVQGGQARAIMPRLLALARAHPFEAGERLPAAVPLDISRELTCPLAPELGSYEREHPDWGMPYGMAPLPDAELAAISSWLSAGAPPPLPRPAPPADVADAIQTWETFLNGESLQQRVVSRYLYEHWFLSHMLFSDHPAGPFYRLIRSSTPNGVAPNEIPTVRPYDDPGTARFWYRLVPVEGVLLHKTHITYELSPAKLAHLKALFLGGDWKATHFPSWDPKEASNPFKTFAEVPARARYQFLLDDSRNFVMNFIRGPVCYGQVAVDVIEDRFFVAFLDPNHDVSIVDPTFLPRVADELELPAEYDSSYIPGELFIEYNARLTAYMNDRAKAVAAADPKGLGPAVSWVWNGGAQNHNALLTVYRHFDNAAVSFGWVGTWPKTAWVMDYPIFERIYYDLVAGFNVYGNLTHQVATRLYMDHLRMESEDLFLSFLPPATREPLRASWYRGATDQVSYFLVDRLRNDEIGTQVRYKTKDPMPELLAQVLARAGAAAGPDDTLNRCDGKVCAQPGVEHALRRLVGKRGPWVALLPSLSLLRVHGVATYSLIHDEAHTNVAFMFGESLRRLPADDEVTVARGISGSYPNFMFEIEPAEAEAFVDALIALRSNTDVERIATQYGVRRTSPDFWTTIDEIQAAYRAQDPDQAALLDLDRYGND